MQQIEEWVKVTITEDKLIAISWDMKSGKVSMSYLYWFLVCLEHFKWYGMS